MTVPDRRAPGVLRGRRRGGRRARTPRALAVARDAGRARSGCAPRAVADEDRAAYHAAASIAVNFLVTLEGAAERLGGDRRRRPRAARPARARRRRELGRARAPSGALTGPIARGDEETVARQRAAVAERTPDLLPLFDALADATRELALETAR